MVQLRGRERAEFVGRMFDRISGRYDFLNTVMTCGRHHAWRSKAAGLVGGKENGVALDVATGTGDFAFNLLSKSFVTKVVGVDFAAEMLNRGVVKAAHRGLKSRFIGNIGDAHKLPYKDNSFICATVGFGARNFIDLPTAISEMVRVIKPGSRVVVLEIVRPTGFIMSKAFLFYFRNITPYIGEILARDREAYTYLPESVQKFMTASDLADLMVEAGLREILVSKVAFGTVAIVSGKKSD